MTLQEQFGQIDIYLFDQILRSNISPGMRVVDAGCGGGRNIQYLLRAGCEVFGVDTDPAAVEAVRKMASELAPTLPAGNFQVAGVEAMPFTDEFADVVVCHSVLHFARDETQLECDGARAVARAPAGRHAVLPSRVDHRRGRRNGI